MPGIREVFVQNLDILAAICSTAVATRSIAQRHPEYVLSYRLLGWVTDGLPASFGAQAPITSLYGDIGALLSTCFASGLLIRIYDRGRQEIHQAWLVGLAVLIATVLVMGTDIPVDLILLGIFPWLLNFALLISRTWDGLVTKTRNDPEDAPKNEKLGWTHQNEIKAQ